MPSDLPTEEVLRTRLRAGDESALRLLLDAWSPSMFRIARSLVTTATSAEEVVQEAWLGVVHGIAEFEGGSGSSLKAWVFRLLVDAAEDRRARDAVAADATASGCPAGDDGASWERELYGVVSDAVAELPPRGRVVMTLRDARGYSADEVCELLDLSPGDQRAILYRARAAVRAHVERFTLTSAPAS
jgi:RNA polymerase sigma-70 factor (ECF subfamily)